MNLSTKAKVREVEVIAFAFAFEGANDHAYANKDETGTGTYSASCVCFSDLMRCEMSEMLMNGKVCQAYGFLEFVDHANDNE